MARGTRTFEKDPADKRDYGFDWSDWLDSGDTIFLTSWTVPSGLTEGAKDNGTLQSKIWLSGGTAGETYEVTCKVTTIGGRIREATFFVAVREL